MPVELLNPDGLPKPQMYRQVSVATGTRLVHLSGQVARDADGEQVGNGDLAAQVEQCYLNIATALAAVGGGFDDVAKLTAYVVDYRSDMLAQIGEGIGRAAARLGVDLVKPVTMLGVSALAEPDLLIEIEAVAVLP